MTHRIPPLTDEEEADIQREIAEDPDNPEVTDEQIAQFKPFAEVFPDLAESIRRNRGRPAKADAKLAVTLRLDPETVDRFKLQGPDWRSRMSEALKRASRG
jgi:uncharacterized protein (DUF4415 family)